MGGQGGSEKLADVAAGSSTEHAGVPLDGPGATSSAHGDADGGLAPVLQDVGSAAMPPALEGDTTDLHSSARHRAYARTELSEMEANPDLYGLRRSVCRVMERRELTPQGRAPMRKMVCVAIGIASEADSAVYRRRRRRGGVGRDGRGR